jgi:hypothetical protein
VIAVIAAFAIFHRLANGFVTVVQLLGDYRGICKQFETPKIL